MRRTLLIILSLALLAGCRREEEKLDNTVDMDNSRAENFFADMFKVVDQVSRNQDGVRDNIIGCIDTLIVDTTSSPRTLLIDFGQDNCVSPDGRNRTGQLFVTFTGRYRDAGSVITVTPQNYRVNGYLLQGNKTITNLGLNDLDQIHFSVQVNGSITSPNNAWTSTWNSSRTRTWVAGSNTLTPWDDEYDIIGSASGVSNNGTPYTCQITTPLRAKVICPWIVSGVFQLSPQGAAVRTFNFGNGDCNSGFSITVNGQTYQFGSGE